MFQFSKVTTVIHSTFIRAHNSTVMENKRIDFTEDCQLKQIETDCCWFIIFHQALDHTSSPNCTIYNQHVVLITPLVVILDTLLWWEDRDARAMIELLDIIIILALVIRHKHQMSKSFIFQILLYNDRSLTFSVLFIDLWLQGSFNILSWRHIKR